MHDCRTLAKRLRDVLIISTAVSCSSGPGAGTTTKPIVGNQADAGAETTTGLAPPQVGADGLPIPDPPFPPYEFCSHTSWCGHPDVGRIRAEREVEDPATPPEEVMGCVAAFSVVDPDGSYQSFYLDEATTTSTRGDAAEGACCYITNTVCGGGRPLLAAGTDGGAAVALLAAVIAGPARGTPDPLARRVGELWLAMARTEHASIASFARAAIELMAVGAPIELVAACQRAGLDEVAHARGCLTLARRYLERDLELGRLPAVAPRAADLRTLAVDTFLEGCVGETVATVIAQRARAGCDDPAAARLLARIGRDEARHAELAWQTVAWAVAQGGAPVAEALREAARTAGAQPAPTSMRAADPRIAPYGHLDDVAIAAAIDDAWREIITPTLALILGDQPALRSAHA